MDNSKEGLLFQKKKKLYNSSFDSISEKQEELSAGSNSIKTKIKKKKSTRIIKDTIAKSILDDAALPRRAETLKGKKSMILSSKKNTLFLLKDENPKKEGKNQRGSIKRMASRKKFPKRSSLQEKHVFFGNLSMSQLNSPEVSDKARKGCLVNKNFHYMNSYSYNNSLFYQNKSNIENSYTRNYSHSRSINNSNYENLYINRAKMKKTTLNKSTLNFNDKAQSSIFDQIKNTDLYEKSEFLLLKIKICYGTLAICSFLCIILNFSDVIIYNNKSLEYLKNGNNNTFIFDKKNVEHYYYINNRKISSKENSIRIFNGIFSLISVVLLLVLYGFTNGANENNRKIGKKEKFNKILNQYYNKQRKKSLARNKFKKEEMKEKTNNEKIKVLDFTENTKKNDLIDDLSSANTKSRIIIKCILNIIFYPPIINKAFVGKYNNIIFIYSLNVVFLIISLYKISNIYRAIFYLSPLNNPLNKAICKSNFIILNTNFMFKYTLRKFPLTFLAFNVIIIVFSICLVISCIEFFSLDINNRFWNTIFENKSENIFNILGDFLFFIIRNIYEEHCIKSILGRIILYMGGLVGMVITTYFIHFLLNLIEFNPEEQDAFSKLIKLLNPINKEHKAAHLIKTLLIIKKFIINNQNTERDYRNKMEEVKRPTYQQRRPIFQGDNFNFAFNRISNSNNQLALNEVNENIEKKKFIRYLGSIYALRIKFILECKNFVDNLKIARNSSLSFNDVLKTVGNKMDGNIIQLNNKLEVLIQNDQKYINYIKFTTDTMKKIKKIQNYQTNLLQYFVEMHNEYVKEMIELKKEEELNSNIPRKMKSNLYGHAFGRFQIKSKIIKSKILSKNMSKKKKIKNMFDFNNTKFTLKKQKSSFVFSNYLSNALKENIKQSKPKQYTNKSIKSRKINNINSNNKLRTKSLDDFKFINNQLKEKLKVRNSLIRKSRKNSVSLEKINHKK